MLDIALFTVGLVAVLVAALFRHLQQWSLPPALLGLVAGVLVGPRALDLLSVAAGDEIHVLSTAARLLLAVALMGIALRYPLSRMRELVREVSLLLLVVLPVMAVVLAVAGTLAVGLPVALALVLGAALSPTDPVLASGIVTSDVAERDIPARDRQVLSLESGANDGLALPLVMVALAWALGDPLGGTIATGLYRVAAAVVVGVLAGLLAGRGLQWAERHREVDESVRSLYPLALAATVLGAAALIRADGLLAVFAAGLAHNHASTGGDRELQVGIDEALNQFLVVPVFLLLGVVLPWSGWAELGWGGLGLALTALLLRRLPVLLAMRRPLRAGWAHVIWLGWFGPIGVAALFYLGHAHERGATDPRIWAAGTLVVAVSTVVHGLTTGIARRAYRSAPAVVVRAPGP